MTRKFIVA